MSIIENVIFILFIENDVITYYIFIILLTHILLFMTFIIKFCSERDLIKTFFLKLRCN